MSQTDDQLRVRRMSFIKRNRRARRWARLRSSDGTTWWLNQKAPLDQSGLREVDAFLGSYAVCERGVEVGVVRLWLEGNVLLFGPWGGVDAIVLTHHEGKLFFSSTGEALDLSGPEPTYSNIPLSRRRPPAGP